MSNKIHRTISYNSGRWDETQAHIIAEQAVTLTVNNEPWLTFMCTPIELESLAIGFLYNEGIINSIDEVASIRVCPSEDNIDVWLSRSITKPEKWIRTSGCSGGETSIGNSSVRVGLAKTRESIVLSAEKTGYLIDLLGKAQNLYRASGGVHTSALSDGEKIIAVAEDIGRHNTLDKLAGHCIMEQISPRKSIILTTGRISSEMIQKAGRIGATIVISRTSPTSLSVEMAEELGMTLIGYARRDRFIIYSSPERILPSQAVKTGKSDE